MSWIGPTLWIILLLMLALYAGDVVLILAVLTRILP